MKLIHTLKRSYNLLLGMAAALALTAWVAGPGIAGGVDETLGGLPGNGSGSDLPGLPDKRPTLFVQGTYAEVMGAVVSYRGEVPELIEVTPGILRRIFHGNVDLVLDEYWFQTSGVELGVQASTVAGAMKYSFVWAGARTAVYTMAEGGVLALPYERFALFDQPAVLDTWNRAEGRATFRFLNEAGRIHVSVQH